MNTYLIIAGVLTALMALVHSVLGERMILLPLPRREDGPGRGGLSRGMRSTLRFTWHLTSVLGGGIAALFFHYGRMDALAADQAAVLTILAITFLISFLVALVGSRGRHPSWAVFLIVALLVWIGAR
ncbi:MAG TPA: hypothetical protein VD886_26645 [Herpetosiphonaceae bacterium]|nr:hypothetical protein [Herpetosiphonaceae bacterium]